MRRTLVVHVAASPRLLHDVVVHNLTAGCGVSVTDVQESVVSVITPDHVAEVRSRVVIVLGDSTEGDVQILIEGQPSQRRHVEASELHALVLDLADRLTHD